MSHTHTIPADALSALNELVSTINATGGVVLNSAGHAAPAADEEWLDLGMAYEQACAVLQVPMLVTTDTTAWCAGCGDPIPDDAVIWAHRDGTLDTDTGLPWCAACCPEEPEDA
jgi:hypothetical protein